MPIQHAIAHHLRKPSDAAAELSLRDSEWATDDLAVELIDTLKSGFLGRISREHGSFVQEEGPSALAEALEGFLGGTLGFLELSSGLMAGLKQVVEAAGAELDVHGLFVAEKSLDNHVFYWLVFRHKAALALGPELTPVPSYAADGGPSLFGIKVDLAEWRERQNYAYLTLLPPRGNPALADGFRALVGFGGGIDKEEATGAFLEGVEAYAATLPEEQVPEYRNRVVEYCMEQDERDEPVALRELAGSLDGVNGDEFVRVMASHSPYGEDDMLVDRRALRRYVKFAGREKDLAISFSSDQLNSRVFYHEESDTLRITGLPKALRSQLLGHKKGPDGAQ